MNPMVHLILAAGFVLAAGPMGGQGVTTTPNLGYLYPAGGKQGSTVEVLAGGQRLAGVHGVLVTGDGVEATVVKHYRPVRNVNGDQRKLLTKLLQDRMDVLNGKGGKGGRPGPSRKTTRSAPKKVAPATKAARQEKAKSESKKNDRKKDGTGKDDKKKEVEKPPVKLPAHPLLENIGAMSLRELEHVRRTFLRTNRNQVNPQIAELVALRIEIAPDAGPGDRTLRLLTPNGLSNPLCFQVGSLPEWSEQEPNEPRVDPKIPPLKPLALPVVVNGQILPGDIDRIRFRAKRGEPVVVDARARQLIPYLADAVPGWFQIVVTVYDDKGRELAYADDFRFSPDPLMRFVPPADGVYQLEVRDSIFRGRRDFVYRIRIGKVPVITELFPLGTRRGLVSKGTVRGWNLPVKTVDFDPGASGGPLRKLSLRANGQCTNTVPYAVDPLAQISEREPNDTPGKPQGIKLPGVINGRIEREGDVDVFRFHGRAGQEVVADVQARRLNSPLDSKLSLLDHRGSTLVHNDDFMEKDGHLHTGRGLITHHADSYLRATLPEDGPYFLVIGDSQAHGGSAYAYRLRLSAPEPRFRALVTPSAIVARAGGHTPLSFHVDRQDGFEGAVDIELVDAPGGYRLQAARIPAGCDHVRATLVVPRGRGKATAADGPIELHFRAVAVFRGQSLESAVGVADDRMQAFLWRHLVPADQFLVMPRAKGRAMVMEIESPGPIRLVPGSTSDVRIRTEGPGLPLAVRLAASGPPPGIVVEDFGLLADGFVLKIRAEVSTEVGLTGNLIVEGWMHPEAKKGGRKPRPYLAAVLPAIPFVVTSP